MHFPLCFLFPESGPVRDARLASVSAQVRSNSPYEVYIEFSRKGTE